MKDLNGRESIGLYYLTIADAPGGWDSAAQAGAMRQLRVGGSQKLAWFSKSMGRMSGRFRLPYKTLRSLGIPNLTRGTYLIRLSAELVEAAPASPARPRRAASHA